MHGAICGRMTDDDSDWYRLSRPVAQGEVIDFFMSHSWHDDSEAKFRTLERTAQNFYRKNGRYPTFWLDKVCINQECIGDGLKVLPINVMACNKVLVLFGYTYVERLWCTWELFILFSFSREEQAAERLMLQPLHEDADVLLGLKGFDVAAARCYDPNEEAKLRHVIEAVGSRVFNLKIQALADKLSGSCGENSMSTSMQLRGSW